MEERVLTQKNVGAMKVRRENLENLIEEQNKIQRQIEKRTNMYQDKIRQGDKTNYDAELQMLSETFSASIDKQMKLRQEIRSLTKALGKSEIYRQEIQAQLNAIQQENAQEAQQAKADYEKRKQEQIERTKVKNQAKLIEEMEKYGVNSAEELKQVKLARMRQRELLQQQKIQEQEILEMKQLEKIEKNKQRKYIRYEGEQLFVNTRNNLVYIADDEFEEYPIGKRLPNGELIFNQ